MKKLYAIIVMEKEDDLYICNGYVENRPYLSKWAGRFETAKQLSEEGYKVTEMLYTTDIYLYLKSLLKVRLRELILVCEYHKRYINKLRFTASAGIIEETMKLQAEYQKTLSINIGRLATRVMRRVTDEMDIPDVMFDERLPWCFQLYEKHCEIHQREVEIAMQK